MPPELAYGLGLFGMGFGIGGLVTYLVVVKPLIQDIRDMRYKGFVPPLPMPEKPQTVSLPYIRED